MGPGHGSGKDVAPHALKKYLDVGDFYTVLTSPLARTLLGHDRFSADFSTEGDLVKAAEHDWSTFIDGRTSTLLDKSEESSTASVAEGLYVIGNAALHTFLQANVTGPPATWISAGLIFPQWLLKKSGCLLELQRKLISNLSVDGESAYRLTPHIEFFCLAKVLSNHIFLRTRIERVWQRVRVNFWQQRMLSERSPSLQENIYGDLDFLNGAVQAEAPQLMAKFLLEQANIRMYYGFDTAAREDLLRAARLRGFDFALTGRLGKRTKYQEKETSQLVVLAKSVQDGIMRKSSEIPNGEVETAPAKTLTPTTKPQDIALNDDTLLESISFSRPPAEVLAYQDEEKLPPSLASLDPENQPTLQPLDSVILLALASSITSTSPQDGLTREETLPYATRVLSGSNSNWQVYTQALLVRSRMEGYRSRTVERGVLQLQALVDQVIADTTPTESSRQLDTSYSSAASTTFLPRPKESESAPVSERLLYIHQLMSPTRWELEAELANRWVSLGGLRTALEIYQRLEMWAEVALCWAANDREDKARAIVRRQLYAQQPALPDEKSSDDVSTVIEQDGKELSPLPDDAPRLFCILGDLDKSPAAYERAWEVSLQRYARAQRSLGRHWSAQGNLPKADQAYEKAVRTSPQHHPTWFALGCVRLQLQDWPGAVNAFGRAVQIEDQDAESWSNLAAALLRLPTEESTTQLSPQASTSRTGNGHFFDEIDVDGPARSAADPQKHTREAFVALKRAAALKRDSYRIWQNLINVSIQLSPPPYTDIIVAQTRLIDLRSGTEGEGCVDVDVVEGLLAHLITASPGESASPQEDKTANDARSRRPGFEKMTIDLIQKRITPLITTSHRLWLLAAKLALHLHHPSAALSAYEKAWRVTLNKPGWENGSREAEAQWREVFEATVELVDAYESLGERKREGGLGEGELVAKDWKFKGRSALRSVMGRAKEGWEVSEGWTILEARMRDLNSG